MKHDLNQNSIIQGYVKGNNFGRLIGMDFEIVEAGVIEYHIQIEEKHLATPIASHGGVVASLMDSTTGISALSLVCEDGFIVSTVELKLNFLAPVFLGDKLIGKSSVLSRGKRLIVTEAEVLNQDGKLVAKGMGTFNVYPLKKAGY
ncbi:PaaI family thioesterase [Crocinitomicaceae bacterium]|mgnify:FL=1|jgi:uncharacterized protein (TIGR00369 family)|nr:PaaI family thioesterase [Crocinitomicaceae bacterium]